MTLADRPTYDNYRDSGVDWLGSIPATWETKKLKFVTQIMKRIAGREGPDVLSITQQGIKVKDITSGEGQLAEDYSNYQLVYRGDFAMNHMDLLTGYVDISQFDGVVSPDYRVFRRTSDELDDRYLLLIFQIGYKQRIFFRYGQGVSLLGRWRFPAENFKEFQVPIPPLPEQRAIAAFLDEKCAKVDEAVRIKEEQIALLRERRQILIQQAVTRGLNPAAPMKDSGIDWIGQIPAHWEVVPLKRLFRERNDRSTTGAETLLSLRMNEGLVPHDDVSDKAIGADALKDYKQVFPGQMVMNRMRASIGIFGMVTSCGIVSPDYAIFDIAARANGDFFLQLFKTGVMGQQFRNASRGLGTGSSGFMRLYTDDFGAISVALPPPAEQTDIVAHINRLSEKIEDAVRLKEEQIAALKEYKTSLINAAVTGKIKVA